MISTPQEHPPSAGDWSWPFWPAVPLYPYGQRRTLRTEVVKDTVWTFDQIQGILYVVVPIRMTVIRLEAGGLLIYAPVAPTRECMRLVQDLVAQHGEIRYIILPTVSGIEHKVFVGPFARQFPQAQVYVAPHQWSFPFNLPLSWLGLPSRRTQILPEDSRQTPFGDEVDYAILGPIGLGLGPYVEVALFHRRSRTVLITDALVSLPTDPPAVVQLDPYPLLFHARDRATDALVDNAANRRKGWQRIALFSMYFQPSMVEVSSWAEAVRDAVQASDRSRKAYFGLFPFRWKSGWEASFEALWGSGRLLVAPILQYLIFNRGPEAVRDWMYQVARWEFERIIPCHLEAPIQAGPSQFRAAFEFLDASRAGQGNGLLPTADVEFIQTLGDRLTRSGITPPPPSR